MADSTVQITPGGGASVEVRTTPSNSLQQVTVIGVPDQNQVVPADSSNGLRTYTPGASTANTPGASVTVGITSVLALAANANRRELTITNDHASNVVYLSLGGPSATVNTGIRLSAAGGQYKTTNYTGAVYAVATGAGTNVCVSDI